MGTELAQQELPEDRVRNFVDEYTSWMHEAPNVGTELAQVGQVELDLSDLKDVLYELEFARELLAAHERHIRKHHTPNYTSWLIGELESEAKEALQ